MVKLSSWEMNYFFRIDQVMVRMGVGGRRSGLPLPSSRCLGLSRE